MSYFSLFPVTSIVLDGENLEIKQVKNILVRAKFSNYLKQKEGLYTPYRVKDNDRPDTLAHSLYGNSNLHWLILLFNDIMDPYFDWPLNQRALANHISDKYSGTAVYTEDTFYYASGTKRSQNINSSEPIINGNTTAKLITPSGEANLLITQHDPTFSKLVVYGNIGYIGAAPSNSNTLVITNSNGVDIETKVRYVEPNATAIHHFEDSEGNWLNPREIPFEDSTESRIRIYTSGASRSLNLLGEVTNTDYEIGTNEKKRVINLVKPEYVDVVISQMADILKPRRKTQV